MIWIARMSYVTFLNPYAFASNATLRSGAPIQVLRHTCSRDTGGVSITSGDKSCSDSLDCVDFVYILVGGGVPHL